MKRLIVFIFFVILFCGINLLPIKRLNLNNIFNDCDVEVYVKDQPEILGYKTIKNGNSTIVLCKGQDLSYILNNYNTNGFTAKLKGISSGEVLNKLNAKIVYKNNFGTYGLVDGVCRAVDVNGKKTNFQIIQKDGVVMIGFPLLLGSY